MATKPLKTLTFEGLDDTYTIPQIDASLSTTGKAADAKATGDSLAEKASASGMVDMAKSLVGGKYTSDKQPYHYRQSPDAGALDEKIVGGTLGWNQLVKNGNFADTSNWSPTNGTLAVSNGIGTFTSNASGNKALSTGISIVNGHKYLQCFEYKSTNNFMFQRVNGSASISASSSFVKACLITEASTNGSRSIMFYDYSGSESWELQLKNVLIIDLTLLFGSTIADYIYSLEQSTAGAGVDWVRQYIDLDTYHEYCEPTLKSVEGLVSRDVVGFNQWDEEWEVGWINSNTGASQDARDAIRSKNYIPVVGGETYHIRTAYTANNQIPYLYWYDADKNWIGYNRPSGAEHSLVTKLPNSARYLKFAVANLSTPVTYNHDICINLSDPSRNGQYEPYEKHSYPLDSSLELRGIPKLSDGKMYFDGDEYPSDGQVRRRYGERAYQSGDESLVNAITDGTTTVYKLTTPTTETAQPFQSPQLVGATEEYVTTGVVPVGHESRYYEDITGKVNDLPSDFSTLIAPVEKSFTATRNYTVGSFVIVNNQLYKVSSAISSGGTITPNSNVTATTIMAEIMALA